MVLRPNLFYYSQPLADRTRLPVREVALALGHPNLSDHFLYRHEARFLDFCWRTFPVRVRARLPMNLETRRSRGQPMYPGGVMGSEFESNSPEIECSGSKKAEVTCLLPGMR